MAPKLDPNAVTIVYLRQMGGELGASSVLGPKLGPLEMSAKKVGDDIAKQTAEWKGLKITVKLTCQNRQAKIDVVPSTTTYVLKELKEPPRDRKKVKNIKHSGNLSLEQVYTIARTMRYKSLAKDFVGTVKEVLGTCRAVGCTVNQSSPQEIQEMLENGDIDCPEQ
ncbi:ribosomal protein RPL12 [Cardiosporidium cionae]|uniref:Ribosomal protein RPL12 n=1 Tax=Cardiosporidium cionae TaxID=476202 RepID=A0ABQ7JBS6_9APIC|nr:ribosomal protein RPL12 [Cardiosporidium cionae]|eukprot:KAF8821462.1 ribosomal protein RPL12 [Cardiosporidium cionae]